MKRQTPTEWLDEAAARLLEAKTWGGTEAEQWEQNARLCLLLAEFAQGQLRRQALVLSIFPGIGLLDMAFEQEGFCIVRGPDVLWGGDIRTFHPPTGVFQGVIGGPPCQAFSRLRHLNPKAGAKTGNLIPEFERAVSEAQPDWWIMENVIEAPEPAVPGYIVRCYVLENCWFGGEQRRRRRFSFGTRDGRELTFEPVIFEASAVASSVLAGHGPVGRGQGYETQISIEEACRLQGLPPDFLADAPFTAHGRRQVIGNGVPRWLGLAVAGAVKRAMEVAT